MDTNSFPDNDKDSANNSKSRITWITIIIVLAVAIIALVVSLFVLRTSRLDADGLNEPNIESRETDGIKTDYIDDEEDGSITNPVVVKSSALNRNQAI
ncbi:MAG: hypothetical protein MJY68_01125 [Bacteroidaceae bacterium]|nr:hypothetical protein [Bacteroidaceae bacterium]